MPNNKECIGVYNRQYFKEEMKKEDFFGCEFRENYHREDCVSIFKNDEYVGLMKTSIYKELFWGENK